MAPEVFPGDGLIRAQFNRGLRPGWPGPVLGRSRSSYGDATTKPGSCRPEVLAHPFSPWSLTRSRTSSSGERVLLSGISGGQSKASRLMFRSVGRGLSSVSYWMAG
jgi:hypothetical protein